MYKSKSEKRVSDRMIRNLSSRLYHADRRRNLTAVTAIALSSMLIIVALSAVLSIGEMMRRSRQMLIGTQAEGVYPQIAYNWFEALQDSGHFDDISIVLYMGHYETAFSTGEGNRILYTDEETASWNFNELLEGRWPEADGEIAVDEHFVQDHGGKIRVGDTVSILLKTAANEIRQDAVICGICTCNDELDEARIYVSEAFERKDKSGYGMSAYCRFERGRYTDNDLKNFLTEVNPQAGSTAGNSAFVNPSVGDWLDAGYMRLIVGLIALTVVCAGLMIYTIYYISMVKNVAQYGRLKLIGVNSRQIRAIVRQHAFRQYLTGLPIGCFLGAASCCALMPFLSFYTGVRGKLTSTLRPEYFLCAATLSYIVMCLGVSKPMRILAKTPPIHAADYTDSGRIRMGKVQSGQFTPGRFARKNIRRRRKNTALVAVSMSIAVLLFVSTMNIIHSLDIDAFLSMINLFADIEIGSEDFLYGLELGEAGDISAIPDEVRDELEKITQDVETVYHYHLQAPVFLYGEDAERYCETVLDNASYQKNIMDNEWLYDVMAGRAKAYRENGNPVIMQGNYRFYDYDQLAGFEVFEGSLDREKFASGMYVLAVALDGEGNSFYHAGDVVELYEEFPEKADYSYERGADGKFSYFEALRKKEYTVLAVVGDTYRNQMAWGDKRTAGFEYVLPAEQMESFDRTPELFLVTMDAPDARTLARVEGEVKECLKKLNGKAEVSYRSKGTYRAGLDRLSMAVSLFGNGLALMAGMMALVNFINSSVSGIAERKMEFSTLQAIGMMRRLLLKILRLENLYTVLFAVIPGYLIGQLLSAVAILKASESIPYLTCKIMLFPGLILATGMGALSMLYPNRRTDIGDKLRQEIN